MTANPPGQPFKFSRAAETFINTKEVSLTSQQCRVLLWIYGELKGEKVTIVCFYRRISGDLEITKKAVQSAVASLKKKNMLLDLGIAPSLRNPRQAIGKRFRIPHNVNVMLAFQLDPRM